MSRRIAVIGGGLGGMSAAALLSAAGHDVTLFEKNHWLGGKCRRVVHDGVVIDTGPAMFTFPQLWDRFLRRWEALSGASAPSPELIRIDGIGRYLHEDYEQTLPFANTDDGWAAWQAYVDKYRALAEPLLTLLMVDPTSHHAIKPALQMMTKLGGHFSMAAWLRDASLGNQKLRDIIELQALNAGGNPEQIPALFAALLATLDQDGVFVPKGGMYNIIVCLHELLQRQNVKVRLNFDVQSIHDRSVVGADGSIDVYDVIVSNLDPVLTAKLAHLSPPKTANCPLSCSVLGLFGAVKPDVSARLPLHQVVVPAELPAFFRQLTSGTLPESTMVFVHNYPQGHPANPDPKHAVMAMLFTVPAVDVETAQLEAFVQQQSARLTTLMGLEPSLDALWLGEPLRLTRSDFAAFGHPSGALYGHLVAPRTTGPFHPIPYRYACKWLWQVGAGVHPGGGIPGTIGGAMIVSEKIIRSLAPKTKNFFTGLARRGVVRS